MDLKKLQARINSELNEHDMAFDALSDQDVVRNTTDRSIGNEFPADDYDDDKDAQDYNDEEEDDSNDSSSQVRINRDNESSIAGQIVNLKFDINYNDFVDKMKNDFGMSLTRDKAHSILDAIREMFGIIN
jgi:hypothetical protein